MTTVRRRRRKVEIRMRKEEHSINVFPMLGRPKQTHVPVLGPVQSIHFQLENRRFIQGTKFFCRRGCMRIQRNLRTGGSSKGLNFFADVAACAFREFVES
jgi:hypothetical protein